MAATRIDQRNLLKVILDEPDDPTHKLVYADVLEELGYDQHAEYVRRISKCRWRDNELLIQIGKGILPTPYTTIALMIYRKDWTHFFSGKHYKQLWTFHTETNGGETRNQRWYGAATNTHNLKRRVMIELMTCRNRNCLCGRGTNDEHEKEKNL